MEVKLSRANIDNAEAIRLCEEMHGNNINERLTLVFYEKETDKI